MSDNQDRPVKEVTNSSRALQSENGDNEHKGDQLNDPSSNYGTVSIAHDSIDVVKPDTFDGFGSYDAMYDALQYASSPTSGSAGRLPGTSSATAPGYYPPLQYPISGAIFNNNSSNIGKMISSQGSHQPEGTASAERGALATAVSSSPEQQQQPDKEVTDYAVPTGEKRTGHCKFFNAVKVSRT
jgi:hypothetical protein